MTGKDKGCREKLLLSKPVPWGKTAPHVPKPLSFAPNWGHAKHSLVLAEDFLMLHCFHILVPDPTDSIPLHIC